VTGIDAVAQPSSPTRSTADVIVVGARFAGALPALLLELSHAMGDEVDAIVRLADGLRRAAA
jgi:hypothetical protein